MQHTTDDAMRLDEGEKSLDAILHQKQQLWTKEEIMLITQGVIARGVEAETTGGLMAANTAIGLLGKFQGMDKPVPRMPRVTVNYLNGADWRAGGRSISAPQEPVGLLEDVEDADVIEDDDGEA